MGSIGKLLLNPLVMKKPLILRNSSIKGTRWKPEMILLSIALSQKIAMLKIVIVHLEIKEAVLVTGRNLLNKDIFHLLI